MAFNEKLPKWDNVGVEPPESKKTEGWQPTEKPPAQWFNWIFNRIYKALEELRNKAEEKTTIGLLANLTTTIKTNIVNALNSVNSDLVAHKAESALKHITESGSNANGKYIKYDDGTMICTHRATLTRTAATYSIMRYLWTYPAQFITTDIPSVVATMGTPMTLSVATSTLNWVRADTPTYSTCNIDQLSTATFGQTDTLTSNMIAIGRWKA